MGRTTENGTANVNRKSLKMDQVSELRDQDSVSHGGDCLNSHTLATTRHCAKSKNNVVESAPFLETEASRPRISHQFSLDHFSSPPDSNNPSVILPIFPMPFADPRDERTLHRDNRHRFQHSVASCCYRCASAVFLLYLSKVSARKSVACNNVSSMRVIDDRFSNISKKEIVQKRGKGMVFFC
ncbi:hypothetical protein NPIL_452301 [Nephila pilipes]|uniref:Uncharacterized protein n=1 Tax=Nephila pilipes TaxID=299642 RepID=A0A8X6J5H3_NEPPI|nr:hypothetical protein NPIL_452301 [Nephila pilipes]